MNFELAVFDISLILPFGHFFAPTCKDDLVFSFCALTAHYDYLKFNCRLNKNGRSVSEISMSHIKKSDFRAYPKFVRSEQNIRVCCTL